MDFDANVGNCRHVLGKALDKYRIMFRCTIAKSVFYARFRNDEMFLE